MGGSSGSQTTTQQAQIPQFLQPFVQQAARTGGGALSDLSDITQANAGTGLVAPFNPNQLAAQQSAIDVAGGGGGFIPTAQNVALEAAGGGILSDLGPGVINDLQRLSGGSGVLSGLASTPLGGPSIDTLGQFAQTPFELDPTAQGALQQSARGDFLFGNAGFDEAVQASIRAAQPGISSTFSAAGPGALSGGLATAARQQVASDAFANLFNQERNRQLQAAQGIGGFQLAGGQQQIGAAGDLGALSLQDRASRAAAEQANISSQQQATTTFGNLLNQERQRQLTAAQQLPGLGLLEADILSGVGGQQQQQAQAEAAAPFNLQLALLEAANTQIPFGSLVGRETSQPLTRNRLAGAAGGALAGGQLGANFGPIGAGVGAVGGGLLGAFA